MLRLLPREHGLTHEQRIEHVAAVNVVRFRKHVERLKHRLYWDLALRQIKLQNRRRGRAAKAAGSR